MKAGLPVRLFVSHAVVAVVGIVLAYLTIRLLVPRLFDDRMGMMGGRGAGMNGVNGRNGTDGSGTGTVAGEGIHDALVSALDTSLLVGLVVGLAAAAVVSLLVTRRLLRPLDEVRTATRRIAAGDYAANVPLVPEPELAALAADVNSLARTLGDTETRRTRLLNDVAHELRTPLTALDGYVEGLIDGVFTADQPTLNALSDELRRLHRLADDLSGVSRAQEQRFDLHLAETDLAELTRRAAVRLEPQFHDAGVTLDVDAEGPLLGRVDPDRIMQVLTNLLGNALPATPAGGRVAVRARAVDGDAQITVTDTGVGLEPADAERIFERFYRVGRQQRRSGGSGVGLTIARGIARAHGGDVTASSPGPGEGSTFRVVLPLRPPETS